MKYLWLFLVLCGCSTMPGDISVSESKAEGSKIITLDPNWCDGMKLGLFKSTQMERNEVYLVSNTRSPVQSLTINIDGEKNEYKPLDQLSDVDQYNFFHKRYRVTPETIKKMSQSKSVHVRANHIGQSFEECEFHGTPAQSSFGKFHSRLQSFN